MEITKIRNSKILRNGKLKFAALSLLIITIIFLLYGRTINFNLTDLDDNLFIHTAASDYKSKTVLINTFKNDVLFGKYPTPFYRPMLTISFAIDNKIAGESENFEHFVNILLHCISAILILLFLSKYIFNLKLSALATLLFAIHPIAAHTVAWIPGRNDSLYFIYFMLSFMFFAEYIDKRKIYIFIISLFWLLPCYFTKESGISIPFIFLFYYYIHKHKNSNSLPVSTYVLWILSILFFLIMRRSVFPSSVNFILTIINGLKISNLYLFLNHISATLFLQTPMAVNLTRKIFILGIISISILLSFGLYKKNKSERKQSLFWLFFIFVFLATDFVGDSLFFHGSRMYIPFFGIIVIFFFFIKTLLQNKKYTTIVYASICIYIISSAAITLKAQNLYENSLVFWGSIINDSLETNITAYKFHSYALMKNGRFSEAANELLPIARSLNFSYDEVNYALGWSFMLSNDYVNAAKLFEFMIKHKQMLIPQVFANAILAYYYLNNQEKVNYYFDALGKLSNTNPQDYINKFNTYLNEQRAKGLATQQTDNGHEK